ncbi:hypothetical protein GQ53DRAFT_745208 [Thozetella sp. PMI_491]|nr:hypothetical protein GQ53DRAFT_745208 [Thozetella sp. PMI_491]
MGKEKKAPGVGRNENVDSGPISLALSLHQTILSRSVRSLPYALIDPSPPLPTRAACSARSQPDAKKLSLSSPALSLRPARGQYGDSALFGPPPGRITTMACGKTHGAFMVSRTKHYDGAAERLEALDRRRLVPASSPLGPGCRPRFATCEDL